MTKRFGTHLQMIINPNPLGCVQNHIQIGGFGTVRVECAKFNVDRIKKTSQSGT